MSIPEAFTTVARAHPDRLAVEGEHHAFTYGELLDRSLSIAGALAAHPGAERIALLQDHDAPLAAAILGALFAGRAYVPLDPSHPRDRLASLIADAGAGALLAGEPHLALARSLSDGRIPVVDRPAAPLAGAPVDPSSVAYLLYTSGSTGRPKAVYQSHENLLLQIGAYVRGAGIDASDRLTLLPSYAVDASLMDLFGALLTGASVHLWDLRRKGFAGFSAWMRDRRIRVYHSTPTVYRLWIAELAGGDFFPDLRRIVLGGEPARASDLAPLGRHFPRGTVLVNGLGPTECTVALQAFFTAEDAATALDPLPVGHPVEGVEIQLAGERGEPADEGEILVRCRAVALGYWRSPEATAASFQPDPGGGDRRIYRCGDRGRRLADGRIAFTGRLDAQLKLRGHRIEPGEIEGRLREDPSVREAVVTSRAIEGREPILVAHLMPSPGALPDVALVRDRLAAILPEPMIPSRFVGIDALPLTPGGKLDRRAVASLPLPPESDEAIPGATAAWLAGLFRKILGAAEIGPRSDFFALGGHSLSAIRLLARLRAEAHVELPLRAVFESPTVAALAARIDEASRASPPVDHAPLARAPRGSISPASFAQERLWLAERLHPGDPGYHVAGLLHVHGPLDEAALSHALDEIVRRHEALRTTLLDTGAGIVQRVHAPFPVAIEAFSPELAAFVRRPFDLEAGPLLRAAWIDRGEPGRSLVLALHHAAADGWSMRLLLTELAALYDAFCAGRPSPLPEPSLQCADHAVWQRATLTPERLQPLLTYWRERLAGLAPLELAADHLRPAQPSRRGASHLGALSPPLVASLESIGREVGVTLHMILLAAYALLLARCSGNHDVAIGVPVAGRPLAELEDVAGTFVDTLVLRIDVSSGLTLRALLGRVRAVALGAQAHADLPFERLVAELRPERDPARNPLFSAMLLLDNLPEPRTAATGVDAAPLDLDLGSSLVDLALSLRPEAGGYRLRWEYATDLFEPSTIARFDSRFRTLLGSFPASHDLPIADLPFLDAAERRVLLTGFTHRPPRPTSILDRIVAQAERDPSAPAVFFGDEVLSYGELLQAASQLAVELRSAGVGRGSLVPIVYPRSLELPAALLAVLAAGAAFVPLDPRWPPERLRSALEFVGSPVILAPRFEASRSSPRLSSISPDPEDPVYAIFTSGSTGAPRLPILPHRGLVNRFDWMDDVFGAASPVSLATTPPSLDSAVWQLLWPLTRGGTTVIPSDGPALSARELVDLVERHRITILDFVPSVLDALLDELLAAAPRLSSLRDVILGGEAIRREAVIRLQSALPGVRIMNLYGPTEASIGCIAHVVARDEPAPLPIGRPIANVRAVVLDEERRLAPLGVPGELYLGGVAVGLGYHRDEAATRASFVDNPFPELGCPTLYRTGDRVLQRADGEIEYVGRLDDQLKIRGLRVEPSEIERALSAHPVVREIAVIGRPGHAGDTELVAWIAPIHAALDLDAFARERLPASLVPSRFLGCDALPRTAAGKIDRRALASRPLPALPPGLPPESALERQIAAIWSDVLGVPTPSIDAGFFELGGHSLLLLRVHHRLERDLGRTIALVDLFRRPTIRSLAIHLAAGQEQAPPSDRDPSFRAAALRRQRDRCRGPR